MNGMANRILRILLILFIPSKIGLFLPRPGRDEPPRHQEGKGKGGFDHAAGVVHGVTPSKIRGRRFYFGRRMQARRLRYDHKNSDPGRDAVSLWRTGNPSYEPSDVILPKANRRRI